MSRNRGPSTGLSGGSTEDGYADPPTALRDAAASIDGRAPCAGSWTVSDPDEPYASRTSTIFAP